MYRKKDQKTDGYRPRSPWGRRCISALFFAFFAFFASFASFTFPALANLMTRKECAKQEGMSWNAQENRCKKSQLTHELWENFQDCEKLEDEGRKKQKCFDNLAREGADVEAFENKKAFRGGGHVTHFAVGGAGVLAAGAIGLINAINKGAGKDVSGCPSLTVLGLTSATAVALEFYFLFKIESKLKELRDDYKKTTRREDGSSASGEEWEGETPYDAQVRAFAFFKKEQEEIEEISKSKKIAYISLGTGFALASALAVAEIAGLGGMTACSIGSAGGWHKSGSWVALAGGVAGAAAEGILAASAAIDQSYAYDNARKIKKYQKAFEAAAKRHCPDGRNDLRKPNCYCYLSSGERNPSRTNSESCQSLWAKRESKLFVKAGNYAQGKNRSACVNRQGKIDQQCRCRRLVARGGKGRNACLQVKSQSASFPKLAKALNYDQVLNDLNQITQGGVDFGPLNSDPLLRRAARIGKVQQKLLETLNKKRRKKGRSPLVLDRKKSSQMFKKHLEGGSLAAAEQGRSKGHLAAYRPGGKGAGDKALKDVYAKLKKGGLFYSGGKGLGTKDKKKKGFANFNFDEGSSSKGGKVQEFMQADYHYKGNDIVERSDVSLWKVLSKRYHQSLGHLFGDDE